MSRNLTDSEIEQSELLRMAKKSLIEKVERQIEKDIEQRYYDMRHPYWREEIKEAIEKRS